MNKKKTIFIDGLGLVEGHFSGVGQYILGILRGMDELLDRAKYEGQLVPEVYVIIPKDTVTKFKQFGFSHIAYKVFPLSFRHMSALWYRGMMPPIDLLYGRGAYIFPRFVDMPLVFNQAAALVIYDLSYELYRQYSDEGNARFLSAATKRAISRTNKIITISQNARQELIDFYKLNKHQVKVATPATDPRLFYRRSLIEIEAVKIKYGIHGDYILALSNLEPRKNLDTLVDVYCRLPKAITNKMALLLVGVSGWKTDTLFQKITKYVESGFNIIRPSDYVSDLDKPAIISGAKMLVYPSHYEGFGMPPLEALACGVPVITADNSSMPEVVGRVAATVPSNDSNKLFTIMLDYINRIDEITQRTIIEGPIQAQHFSWEASAKVFFDSAEGQ